MKKIIFALLVTAVLFTLLSFAGSAAVKGSFEKAAGTVYLQYGTPTLDGNITENEGWGKSVSVSDKNLAPISDQEITSCPSGKICYAYDENYLYFAADVIDDDYIFCTKYFEDNIIKNGFGKSMSFFAYDGDVIALAFDWKNLLVSHCGFLEERPTFFCFGLFEDGHVGAYHTVMGEKDLTDIAKTAGKRTVDGWCFEAAIPWNEIDADLDVNSLGVYRFDYDEMTAPGVASKACVYFVDRFEDEELGDIGLDNVFGTTTERSLNGVLTMRSNYYYYGVFGIDLLPTKNGGADCGEWENPFTDLDKNAWYYNAVATACKNGWFAGTTKTTFTPNGKLTRAMFVKVLASLAGYNGTSASGAMYKDVPAGKWYSASVEWATNAGIAAGTGGGNFSPDGYLTREQAALFLYKYAQYKKYSTDGIPSGTIDTYPDRNKVSGWAVSALEWAVHNGFISGNRQGGVVYLDPKGTATRAQCATIVRAFDAKYAG